MKMIDEKYITENLINYNNQMIKSWLEDKLCDFKDKDPFLSNILDDISKDLFPNDYLMAMPEPYYGNPSSNLFTMINLNPGYSDGKKKDGDDIPADKEVLSRKNMREFLKDGYYQYAVGFPHLDDNAYHQSAAIWWKPKYKRISELINNIYCCQEDKLRPFVIDLCPWHSKKWNEIKIDIKSEKVLNHIEQHVLIPAQYAAEHSKLKNIIISVGKNVYEVAQEIHFERQREWNADNHNGLKKWPNEDGKNIKFNFAYLKKDEIKLLCIWSTSMNLPSKKFDGVLKQIFTKMKEE